MNHAHCLVGCSISIHHSSYDGFESQVFKGGFVSLNAPDEMTKATTLISINSENRMCVTFREHSGFHAAWNKIDAQKAVIRLALDSARSASIQEHWCLYLDADIGLPVGFQKVFERVAPTLDRSKLYGAAGRKNVATLHEVRGLAEFGAWSDEGAEVHRKTVGYFHLFHSSAA